MNMEDQELDIEETMETASIVDGQPSLNTQNVVGSIEEFAKSLESRLAKFFCEAHSNIRLSVKIIQMQYEQFKCVMYNTIKELLQTTSSNHSDQISILHCIDEICAKFKSDHFQRTYFIEKGTFVAPVNQNPNHRNTSGFSTKVATIQFIPMRKVLANLFRVEGMMETIDTHLGNLEKCKKTVNIIQGKSWKKMHPTEMRNGKCYPIVIYHNTLELKTGSKHREMKIGALHMWLPFLPHHIALQLDFPITVYEMNSTNSNDQLFTPVINEINCLAAVGVNVHVPGYYTGTVRFKLVAVVGDSEELRNILGFTRSLRVTYPCRMCREEAADLEELSDERDLVLRNLGIYLYDVRLNDPLTTGIEEQSVWLKVRNFDLFENATEDFVEDFLQNVCPIVMTVVVPALIEKKFFSLKSLNEAIETFKYGPDASSKPPKFTEKGPFRFRMSSNQCLTFMRYFSLMVGPGVDKDKDDEHWELYLLTRGLMLDLMKEEFDDESVEDLQNAIRWFNNSFMKESEEAYLRPSFHRLVHYPWLIENLGPLKPLWEVRQKSKLTMSQIFENQKTTTRTKSGNSCRVIANRHQWLLNSFFYNNLVPPVRICAEMETVWKATQLKLKTALDLSSKVSFKQVKWVTYRGITYREGYVICYNEFDLCEELDSAKFGLIRDIYVDSNSDSVFFICWTVKTSEYEYHTCTYEAEWKYPYFYGADAVTFVSLDRVKHRHPSIFSEYNGDDFFYSGSMFVISRNSW